LIGISCHEKEYRLAWSLNQLLGWNLARVEDVLNPDQKTHCEHACFVFEDEEMRTVFTLVENATSQGALLPELLKWDYLLKIEYNVEIDSDQLLRTIRKSPFVLAAIPLLVEKLKLKQNLIFQS
jgi:hypothetical protein